MYWVIAIALLVGYVLGRVRPLRRLFRPAPQPADPHMRIVRDAHGNPVQIFCPDER